MNRSSRNSRLRDRTCLLLPATVAPTLATLRLARTSATSMAASSIPRTIPSLPPPNEQSNGPAIGFLNPTIYSIGQTPNYGSDFHDITGGDNFNNGSPNLFSDVAGYDLVTGWGSPNGQSLLNTLGPAFTGPNFGLTASITTLHIFQGGTGSSTITANATNGFSGAVDLRAVALGLPAGLSATLSSSAVAAGGSSVLTI